MRRYIPLGVFIFFTILGLIIKIFDDEKINSLWDFYNVLDTASAVALSILAFFGYYEYIKSEDKIKIYFQVDNIKKIDTHLTVLRKNCTRSELFGILGMLQTDGKSRYSIKYSKDKNLLVSLQSIQKGDLNELVIPVSPEEIEQFDYIEDNT